MIAISAVDLVHPGAIAKGSLQQTENGNSDLGEVPFWSWAAEVLQNTLLDTVSAQNWSVYQLQAYPSAVVTELTNSWNGKVSGKLPF